MILKQLSSLQVKIILLLSILIVAVTIVLTLVYIQNLNALVYSNTTLFSKTMIKNEKRELQNKIDLAHNILEMYYKKTTPPYIEGVVKKSLISHQEQLFHQLECIYHAYKAKESSEQLRKRLLDIVKYSRYGTNGYFWINNMDYEMVMHPIKPEYDGKIFVDTPLVPFVQLGVDSLKKNNTKSAYIKYKFYNPATKEYEFKVSLVKFFEPFGWVIGTGKYLSDVTPMMQLRALKDIEALRYGDNGYFWVNDMHYKMLMHPIKPQYNQNVFMDTPDVPFVKMGVDALNNTEKDSAIIRYSFHNPATGKYEDKLSVVKLFKPWNWVIGTGVYINGIKNSIEMIKDNKQQEEHRLVIKIVLISISIILLVLFLAYYLIGKFIINPMRSLHIQKKYFEEIAQIDFLTNILNRRAFKQEVEHYISYAHRNNLEINVLMLDIDFFKKVNDTYGHDAGDEVLRTLSNVIKTSLREEDIFGRLGGEEFGICILDIDATSLCQVANKIRKNIEETYILYAKEKITITISIGAYNFQKQEDSFEVAFKKADKALYEAKKSGRNRVILYEASHLC